MAAEKFGAETGTYWYFLPNYSLKFETMHHFDLSHLFWATFIAVSALLHILLCHMIDG